jgi:tetratricopeptide (TPR) repeat protein
MHGSRIYSLAQLVFNTNAITTMKRRFDQSLELIDDLTKAIKAPTDAQVVAAIHALLITTSAQYAADPRALHRAVQSLDTLRTVLLERGIDVRRTVVALARLEVWQSKVERRHAREQHIHDLRIILNDNLDDHEVDYGLLVVGNDTLGLLLRRTGKMTDLEEAKKLFRQVIEYGCQCDDVPATQSARHNLAVTLLDTARGRRTAEFEEAVQYIKELLEEYHLHSEEYRQALLTWTNTALEYPDESARDAALQDAISRLEKTLEETAEPFIGAELKIALAEAYFRCRNGDRSEMFQRAIDKSGEVIKQGSNVSSEQLQKAMLVQQRALVESGSFDTPQARERIIRELNQTRQDIDRDTQLILWASYSNTLGIALTEAGKSAFDCARLAVRVQQETCAVLEKVGAVQQLSIAQAGLAAACASLAEHHDPSWFPRALEVYEQLTSQLAFEANPHRWRVLQTNYARTLCRAGHKTKGLEKANEVLQRDPDDHDPRHLRNVYMVAGSACFELKQWLDALEHFQSALTITNGFLNATQTELAEREELGQITGIPGMVAYCHAQQGRTRLGVEVLERYRACVVARNLERHQTEGYGDADEISERLRQRNEYISQEDTSKFAAQYSDIVPTGPQRAISSTESLDAAWDFERIQQVVKHTERVLVYSVCTPVGSCHFVVGHDSEPYCLFCDVNQQEIENFLYSDDGGKREPLTTLMYFEPQNRNEPRQKAAMNFDDTHWGDLSRRLLEPLAYFLSECHHVRIALIPIGLLAITPMHVMGNIPTPFAASLPHSARLLEALWGERDRRAATTPSLLAIANPTRDLEWSEPEVTEVSARLGIEVQMLCRNDATRNAIQTAIVGKSHLHYAGHATFDRNNPYNAAWRLAGGETLTVEDVLRLREQAGSLGVVTMSACKSGVFEIEKAPDQPIGFQAAWAELGVPSVVAALWNVGDQSGMLLMSKYSEELRRTGDPSLALHEAQRWASQVTYGDTSITELIEKLPANLRTPIIDRQHPPEEKVFTSPYKWACFVCWGV